MPRNGREELRRRPLQQLEGCVDRDARAHRLAAERIKLTTRGGIRPVDFEPAHDQVSRGKVEGVLASPAELDTAVQPVCGQFLLALEASPDIDPAMGVPGVVRFR